MGCPAVEIILKFSEISGCPESSEWSLMALWTLTCSSFPILEDTPRCSQTRCLKCLAVDILCDRIYRLTSSFGAMHVQFDILESILLKNGYPLRLIQAKIKQTVSRLISPHPKPTLHTCAKKSIFVSLPYTGKHGIQLRNKLQKLFRRYYPRVVLRVIFKPTFRLSDLSRFKDRIPLKVRSHYQYSCGSCNATYIGMTARHLRQRVCEHLGVSSRIGNELQVKVQSAIRDHSELSGHPLISENFKIISTAGHPTDLPILEELSIASNKPSLNTLLNTGMPRLYS